MENIKEIILESSDESSFALWNLRQEAINAMLSPSSRSHLPWSELFSAVRSVLSCVLLWTCIRRQSAISSLHLQTLRWSDEVVALPLSVWRQDWAPPEIWDNLDSVFWSHWRPAEKYHPENPLWCPYDPQTLEHHHHIEEDDPHRDTHHITNLSKNRPARITRLFSAFKSSLFI